jgi:NADH:ubiquinone oxidoreductase subunit K
MNEILALSGKACITLLIVVFVVGLSTMFLRRIAVWSLVGQLIAMKAVAACGYLLTQFVSPRNGDLIVLSLVATGLVPVLSVVGLLVLHRCGRFGGTLDVDEEKGLRH